MEMRPHLFSTHLRLGLLLNVWTASSCIWVNYIMGITSHWKTVSHTIGLISWLRYLLIAILPAPLPSFNSCYFLFSPLVRQPPQIFLLFFKKLTPLKHIQMVLRFSFDCQCYCIPSYLAALERNNTRPHSVLFHLRNFGVIPWMSGFDFWRLTWHLQQCNRALMVLTPR